MQAANVVYFLVWAGLIFLIMRFGCGAHIMGHGHHHEPHADDRPDEPPRLATPEKAVDRVCGMTVATATAKSAVYQGQVYYFCSQSCREKFEASPAAYALSVPAPLHQGEKYHAC